MRLADCKVQAVATDPYEQNQRIASKKNYPTSKRVWNAMKSLMAPDMMLLLLQRRVFSLILLAKSAEKNKHVLLEKPDTFGCKKKNLCIKPRPTQ